MGQLTHGTSPGRARWYVLEVKQHREDRARLYLANKGIDVYLPKMRQWPRPAVGGDIVPLFSGYVFVRLDLERDYRAALWTPGVKGFVVLEAGAPAEMPVDAIDFLKSREGEDGLVVCGAQEVSGREVLIDRGPFRGFYGVVAERLTARERVVVLLDFLQPGARFHLPERWLKETPRGAG